MVGSICCVVVVQCCSFDLQGQGYFLDAMHVNSMTSNCLTCRCQRSVAPPLGFTATLLQRAVLLLP